MYIRISKRLTPALVLFAAVFAAPASAALISGVAVGASNSGDSVSYATNKDISIYDPAGLSVNAPHSVYTSTATLPGATSAGVTLNTLFPDGVGLASSASANLGTGILRATAITSVGGVATTSSLLKDYVTFSVAGGGSAQIQLNLHLDGRIAGTGPNINFISAGRDDLNFGLGAAGFGFTGESNGNGNSFVHGGTTSSSLSGFDSYKFSNESVTGFDFTGLLTVQDGQTSLLFDDLILDCQGGASCDFSNTSKLGLTLPKNVTFTSASGVLLTSVPSSVPEPGTFAIGLPLIGLAACIWRRKRA